MFDCHQLRRAHPPMGNLLELLSPRTFLLRLPAQVLVVHSLTLPPIGLAVMTRIAAVMARRRSTQQRLVAPSAATQTGRLCCPAAGAAAAEAHAAIWRFAAQKRSDEEMAL